MLLLSTTCLSGAVCALALAERRRVKERQETVVGSYCRTVSKRDVFGG
eukprot:SAG31_NODE_1556_length_7893_cov_1.993585_6_plen_48_part_00